MAHSSWVNGEGTRHEAQGAGCKAESSKLKAQRSRLKVQSQDTGFYVIMRNNSATNG